MNKFPDGMDLDSLIVKMWINCLVNEGKEEYGIPEKLNMDIASLEHQMEKSEFLHYVSALKEMSTIVHRLKEHREKL